MMLYQLSYCPFLENKKTDNRTSAYSLKMVEVTRT